MKSLDLSLYLVLDAQSCETFTRLITVAEQALAAGITVLQLRSHHPDWTKRFFYDTACTLKPLCATYQVPFIINDEVDIALAVDADGVHIGQEDLPPERVRQLIGADKILGLSTHNLEQACAVNNNLVDYIGMGPVYPTRSKQKPDPVLGLSGLADIIRAKSLPGVAIGGINAENVEAVRALHPDGIAVISAICQADDIALAVQKLSGK